MAETAHAGPRVALENKRELDKGTTGRFVLAEIATSPLAPRNDKAPWHVMPSEVKQALDNL
jgi:hypothetical protein